AASRPAASLDKPVPIAAAPKMVDPQVQPVSLNWPAVTTPPLVARGRAPDILRPMPSGPPPSADADTLKMPTKVPPAPSPTPLPDGSIMVPPGTALPPNPAEPMLGPEIPAWGLTDTVEADSGLCVEADSCCPADCCLSAGSCLYVSAEYLM